MRKSYRSLKESGAIGRLAQPFHLLYYDKEGCPSFVAFKGRGFRPRAPDFRIELELARVSRQNHLLHALVNPSVLKPAKAGAASLVVLQMFTKLQKLGQPPLVPR